MATGRTLQKFARAYINGTDLSSEALSLGALGWDYGYQEEAALAEEVKGGLCGPCTITTGDINTIWRFSDTAADSPHDIIDGWNGAQVNLMVPIGIRAAPLMGDPVWMVPQAVKAARTTPPDAGMLTTTISFATVNFAESATPTALDFDVPWGNLLHAKASRAAANAAIGLDGTAGTLAGAWMMAQIFSITGAGTATIKVQHADNNIDGDFADVAGLTTGAVTNTSAPIAVWAQTTKTTAIKRYLRWQLALVGSTACSFALSVARGR